MDGLVLGIVSNCWAALLPKASLHGLCHRARQAGFRYVELRQRALGDHEKAPPGDDRPWPLADRLGALGEAHPTLGFNLAVEAPFLTQLMDPDDSYFAACADAALSLGGQQPALRLVDLSPAPALLADPARIDELGVSVAALADYLWRRGVVLALENSKQPVAALRAVTSAAATHLPAGVPVPRLCWDPQNQIAQQLQPEDPVATARDLRPEELFEFHFKQSRGGALQPDVGDGDLDWRAILTALDASGYQGPALYEIPPGPDIWDRLHRSQAYIAAILAG
jgi:sugar phosphate isomerase/epimerase